MTPPEPEEPRDTEPPADGPSDTVADPPAEVPAVPTGPTAPAGPAARGRVELPTDVDAVFAAMVAGWSDEAPRWPDDGDGPHGPSTGELSAGVGLATPPGGEREVPTPSRPHGPTPAPATPPVPTDGPPAPTPRPTGPRDDEPPAVDEHFVPPEPPPLPRLGLSSLLGLLLLVVGVVLLAVPGVAGASIGLGIVPGLLAMTAGLGWLVFGMRRPSERDGRGPDGEV